MKISAVHARQILDSRGNPTIETDITLVDGTVGRAAIPSGASTGSKEAMELRDHNMDVYLGQDVLNAVENVNTTIAKALIGKEPNNQSEIDKIMIDLDGTENKSNLGANAILSVSLAAAHAAANSQHIPLYEYIYLLSGKSHPPILPLPMMNIINGGKHANFASDIQEFMIMPVSAVSFSQALEMGSEIFHTLGKVLTEEGYDTTVGDEGGYAPRVRNGNAESLNLISKAVEHAGFVLGKDVVFALDIAATELWTNDKYQLKTERKTFTSTEMIDWLCDLAEKYPIRSIEDGLSENDWSGWQTLTSKLGSKLQLIGDDLLVTNTKLIQKAINEKAANAVLIKPNQIGTLSETISAVKMAQAASWHTIMSHRSGETEDTTIAHLAVGLATGQIKTGSLSRSERIAKYNELLRIEEQMGDDAKLWHI